MNNFTCTACSSVFETFEAQKSHYKLDWHRYNLKRKVATLPPVSEEEFRKRVNALSAASSKEKQSRASCSVCQKKFKSEQLLKQHFESRKHRVAEKESSLKSSEKKKLENADSPAEPQLSESPVESSGKEAEYSVEVLNSSKSVTRPKYVDDDDISISQQAATAQNEYFLIQDGDMNQEKNEEKPAPFGPDVCIFCNEQHVSVEANAEHMLRQHGFFIPDREYLIDLSGLITYCSEKVKYGHICLTCNGRGRYFKSWKAAQQHMCDVSHCHLLYEEGEDLHEFEKFYDFRPSYQSAGNGALDLNDDETINTQLYSNIIKSQHAIVSEFGELFLPDGRVIGHRQYNRWYKQSDFHRILPHDTYEPALCHIESLEDSRKLHVNRALQKANFQSTLFQSKQFNGSIGEARRRQYIINRTALNTAINNNRLNRTFKRVLLC